MVPRRCAGPGGGGARGGVDEDVPRGEGAGGRGAAGRAEERGPPAMAQGLS